MSASHTTLRLITVLFLLAGILLLRKPVFGQTNAPSPQIQTAHPFAHPPVTIIESRQSPAHRISIEARNIRPLCIESPQPWSR